MPGHSLLVYARAFELAGLTGGAALAALTSADLDRAERAAGGYPILPQHRAQLLAASAALALRVRAVTGGADVKGSRRACAAACTALAPGAHTLQRLLH